MYEWKYSSIRKVKSATYLNNSQRDMPVNLAFHISTYNLYSNFIIK